jgi:hypothetical protein
LKLGPRAANTSLLLLLVFPFAWYLYGPVYADAFCLAAILGAFLALERDRLWLAGMLGCAASAARPVGLVVAVALVLRLIERRNSVRIAIVEREQATSQDVGALDFDGAMVPPAPFGVRLAGRVVQGARRIATQARARFALRDLRWSDTRILLAFGGFVAWCAFLWVRFGDPLLWQQIQSVPGWDQGSGPATWFKVFLFEQMVGDAHSPFTWSKVGQGLLALGVVVLVPRIARRFGWAYAAFTLGAVMLPIIGTKDFMGTGRYLLVAFPAFALVGEWLADRRPLRVGVLVTSGVLLVFLTTLFARGHYLA